MVVELGALMLCGLSGLDALRVAHAAEAAGVALTFRGQSAQLQWMQRTGPPFHTRRSPAGDCPDRLGRQHSLAARHSCHVESGRHAPHSPPPGPRTP